MTYPVIYLSRTAFGEYLIEMATRELQVKEGPKVIVLYSCQGCGVEDRAIEVPARKSVEQNVVDWLNLVRTYVGVDHAKVSGHCTRTTCDLKLPMAGDVVGGVLKQ